MMPVSNCKRVFWSVVGTAFLMGAAAHQEAKPKQGQQGAGDFRVESFEKGKAIPIGKAKIVEEPGQPPVITYPASRESSTWIATPKGGNVAIGEGIDWQGKTAYLSLTYSLVLADAKTGQALWSTFIGAFWDTVTFVNIAKENEPARWAVGVKSSKMPEYLETYDLETGRKLGLAGGPRLPAGTTIKPRQAWSGSAGVRSEKLYRLVGSAAEWTTLRAEIFGDNPQDIPTAADIDFSKEALLVCYLGKSSNCRGIHPVLVVEDNERLLLRLGRSTYQSDGNPPEEHPYGLILLPRRPGKPVVLQRNTQSYIAGPAIWKEFLRVELAKAE